MLSLRRNAGQALILQGGVFEAPCRVTFDVQRGRVKITVQMSGSETRTHLVRADSVTSGYLDLAPGVEVQVLRGTYEHGESWIDVGIHAPREVQIARAERVLTQGGD